MTDSEYRDVVAEMLGQVLPEGDWQTSAASPLRVEGGAWVAVSIWVPNEEETEDPELGKSEEKGEEADE